MKMTFCAPCIFGLEGYCANEFRFLGLNNVRAENGRVLFDGDFSAMARANINAHYAERIQILLGEFRAVSFEELFNRVKALNWADFIGPNDAFPVKGSCLKSQLMSMTDCQKIIKKAVVNSLSARYMLSWFEETGAVHQIQFLVMNDRVSMLLDTTGAGLHKRGYRAQANDAPLKETLAAAMVEMSGVRRNHFVVDPMCGSGTILIEAAMKALKIAPGLTRRFAAEEWGCVPDGVFEAEREAARAKIDRDCPFRAEGYDIDEAALAIAEHNAEVAGVGDRITFQKRDIRDFSVPEGYCTVITNPPYGERLLDLNTAEALYAVMGQRFKREKGKRYTVITPDDDFEKIFGRKADKRRKTYNGMLKCQIYQFFK